MEEIEKQIRKQLEDIRDERGMYANTATRIGEALLALLSYSTVALDKLSLNFLSKLIDDVAQGMITFLSGLKIGNGGYGIDRDGRGRLLELVLDELRTRGYTGDDLLTDKGFRAWRDEEGRGHIITDYLDARVKAVFAALEVRKAYFTGGNLFVSGAGAKIAVVKAIDKNDVVWDVVRNSDGTITLRRTIQQLPVVGGKVIGVGSVLRHTQTEEVIYDPREEYQNTVIAWRCYWLASDGEKAVENEWQVGDQALCETFRLRDDYDESAGNKRYWRLVVRKGAEALDDGRLYNYVDLANFGNLYNGLCHGVVGCHWVMASDTLLPKYNPLDPDQELHYFGAEGLYYSGGTGWGGYKSGSSGAPAPDLPEAGDEIVQCGSQTDTSRQGMVQIAAVGSEPMVGIYAGIDGFVALADRRQFLFSPSQALARAGYIRLETTGGTERLYNEHLRGRAQRYVVKETSEQVILPPKGLNQYLLVTDQTATDMKALLYKSACSPIGQGYIWEKQAVEFGDVWECEGTGLRYVAMESGWQPKGEYIDKASFRTEINGDTATAIATSQKKVLDEVAGTYVTQTNFNSYTQSSEETISEITRKQTASETDISNLADGQAAQGTDIAALKNGKNLLTGVLTGTGWGSSAAVAVTPTLHYLAVADGVFSIKEAGDSYVVSPPVRVEEGKTYCFSFYWSVGGGYDIYVVGRTNNYVYRSGSGGWIGTPFTSVATEDVRIFVGGSVRELSHPQLELGSARTEFVTNATEVSSIIKQTADRIEMKVRTELGETGIDIDQKQIRLIGDQVGFYNKTTNTEYIKIGLEDALYNGQTVKMPYFIFMAPDGVTEMYNLGYTGLRQLVNNAVPDKWTAVMLMGAVLDYGQATAEVTALQHDTDGMSGDLINPMLIRTPELSSQIGENGWFDKSASSPGLDVTPMGEKGVWVFSEGYTVNAQGQRIYNIGGSTPSQYDGCYYCDQETSQQGIPLHPVNADTPDYGWYFVGGAKIVYVENGVVKATGAVTSEADGYVVRTIDPATGRETIILKNWYRLTMKVNGQTVKGVVNDKGGTDFAGYNQSMIPVDDFQHIGQVTIPDFPEEEES